MCKAKFICCVALGGCSKIHSFEIDCCEEVKRQNNLHCLSGPSRINSTFIWSPMPGCEGLEISSSVAWAGFCDEHFPPEFRGPAEDLWPVEHNESQGLTLDSQMWNWDSQWQTSNNSGAASGPVYALGQDGGGYAEHAAAHNDGLNEQMEESWEDEEESWMDVENRAAIVDELRRDGWLMPGA